MRWDDFIGLMDLNDPDECWEWPQYHDPRGYGRVHLDGRHRFAHCAAYEVEHGPIPDGLEIDHLCRNHGCFNPAHLEAVTHLENMRRSAPARKARCAHGHPYTPENTYIRPGGGRDCRACIRRRVARYQEQAA